MASFHYPGEYVYKGKTYTGMQVEESIKKVDTELCLDTSDIVIATYPKSGTTWMEQVLHSVDVGPEEARKRTQCMADVIKFIDLKTGPETEPTQYHQITNSPPPHRIKTHLDATFYERFLTDPNAIGPKFIVVVRNPKDTLVSYYHFHRMLPMAFDDGSWDDFFQLYKMKRLMYGDVLDYNLSWWKYAEHKNVLFLHFEDKLQDLAAAVRQVADFVGRHLTEEEIKMAAYDASFPQMKEKGLFSYLRDPHIYNEKRTFFFRAGKKDDWPSLFTEEQSALIDRQVKDTSESVGLFYKY